MKITDIILKNLKEQARSIWILLLTLSMGPFFIFVYFLIIETSKPQYNILIINNDEGAVVEESNINHGSNFIDYFKGLKSDTAVVPFNVETVADAPSGIDRVKKRKSDALIIISRSFSNAIESKKTNDSTSAPGIEIFGDLTSTNYLISAVWANEALNQYIINATNSKQIIEVKETALGISARINEFDMVVPGILIVSVIMLMFTASIAFVAEVENKTIMRLKLSRLSAIEFLGGISIVQLLVGLTSIILTLITAIFLGFNYSGSVLIMIVIAAITSLSIIAFSLIIAALTRSANEVLVVGNFPIFLFMFFTGAAFPLRSEPLFSITGYPITLQGFMSPSHAISALNKTLIMNMDMDSIIPEITAILILTIVYFIIGAAIFKHRHLKLGKRSL